VVARSQGTREQFGKSPADQPAVKLLFAITGIQCIVCIDMFTSIMFKNASIRDVMTDGAVVASLGLRCNASSVGCVLRESQMALHVSSLTSKN
jgi:hypothetical protein